MAQGKKYPIEVEEKARVALTLNNNIAEVSRQIKIPETTLRTWMKKWADDKDFAELRALRKREFAEQAWKTAFDGLKATSEGIKKLDTDTLDASGINQIANATSKLYQMQALAVGDATERVEGEVKVTKFEDM